MEFQRRGEPGKEIPAVLFGGIARDLRPLTADITPSFIRHNSVGSIGDKLNSLPEIADVDSMRVGAPIKHPGAVYCVGLNYAKHAAEGGVEAPENIVIFFKPPHTLAGPNDEVVLSPGFAKVDWEVELAIVVGKTAWQLTEEDDSSKYIFGFALANDLSDRYWQLEVSGGQWSKGKSGPGFLPFGPSIVPTANINTGNLRLQSWVNGAPRQDSTTRDMIFSVDEIVRNLSQFTVLEPGDVILTGTPEGVALSGRFPYLADGDEVVVSIDGLGAQRQRVVAASLRGMP